MNQGKVTNGNIIVKFDYNKSDGAVKQANGLYIPERYLIEGDDEEAPAAYGVTTNRKLINPQVVDILVGNEDYINFVSENYPSPEREWELEKTLKVAAGRRAFVYYGAFEIANWLDGELAVIPAKNILFFLDPIECVPSTYLGDEVFTAGPRTDSGIWLTPITETKDGVKIIITHVPENAHPLVKVGTTVVTVDSHQYDLDYNGKKYIKLKESEIVGIETIDGIIPIGDRVLVEYMPDEELAERIAENDRRATQRDFIGKSRLHIDENYARGLNKDYIDLEEPKTTRAKVIAAGDTSKLKTGDILIVHRYFGCKLLNGQWILNNEAIYGSITAPVSDYSYGEV